MSQLQRDQRIANERKISDTEDEDGLFLLFFDVTENYKFRDFFPCFEVVDDTNGMVSSSVHHSNHSAKRQTKTEILLRRSKSHLSTS